MDPDELPPACETAPFSSANRAAAGLVCGLHHPGPTAIRLGEMQVKQKDESERDDPNPAARRDKPGETHDDLVKRETERSEDPPKSYQDADRSPRDHGGIAD
ncbi:hypothetical protein BH23GEM6_BH23GEM6_08610 [soil metagenome]